MENKKIELNEEILDTVSGGFGVDTKINTGYEKENKGNDTNTQINKDSTSKTNTIEKSTIKGKNVQGNSKNENSDTKTGSGGYIEIG